MLHHSFIKIDSFSCSNRAVYVIHPTQRSAQIAARAAGGDAALYPAQNDGKTIIVNNDWNVAHDSYI